MHTHMTGSKIMKVCVLLSSLQTYSLNLLYKNIYKIVILQIH